ncbi:uncharacterized protein ISCGN_023404 [Ixodes scapularis]
MVSYAVPPQFDEAVDKWPAYQIRLEAFFEGNGVTDGKKKSALLVAALSTNTVDVISGRCAPAKVNELPYSEVVSLLQQHFSPKLNETAQSYKFFSRNQLPGEPVRDFVVAIRQIADTCNFGDTLDRMLKDRIVCGLQNSTLKVEAELRFRSTMVTMLGKLEEVKRAFCGDDPTTFLNIEDHLRSRLARSSLITTELESTGMLANGGTIILISDGEENTDPYIADELPRLVAKGVIVHTFALGSLADEKLQDVALQTGGRAYAFGDLQKNSISSMGISFVLSTTSHLEDSQKPVFLTSGRSGCFEPPEPIQKPSQVTFEGNCRDTRNV